MTANLTDVTSKRWLPSTVKVRYTTNIKIKSYVVTNTDILTSTNYRCWKYIHIYVYEEG